MLKLNFKAYDYISLKAENRPKLPTQKGFEQKATEIIAQIKAVCPHEEIYSAGLLWKVNYYQRVVDAEFEKLILTEVFHLDYFKDGERQHIPQQKQVLYFWRADKLPNESFVRSVVTRYTFPMGKEEGQKIEYKRRKRIVDDLKSYINQLPGIPVLEAQNLFSQAAPAITAFQDLDMFMVEKTNSVMNFLLFLESQLASYPFLTAQHIADLKNIVNTDKNPGDDEFE